jgi:hypothetical protein
MCLEDLFTTGKHENEFAACTPPRNKKEILAIKAQWKSFLHDHGKAIRNGKRFEREVFSRLMHSDADADEEK